MEDGSIVNQIPVDFCRSQHHIGTGVPVKGKGAVSLAVKLYEGKGRGNLFVNHQTGHINAAFHKGLAEKIAKSVFADFSLEPGKYRVLVFNQSTTEFGTLEFQGMDSYETARAVVLHTTSRWYSRGDGEQIGVEPEWLASDKLDEFDVSGDYSEATLTPRNVLSHIQVNVKVPGIGNLYSARGSLTGISDGFLLGQGKPLQSKVTYLLESWTKTIDKNDATLGTLKTSFKCFGLPETAHLDAENNKLSFSALLIDKKTQVDYQFAVGDKFKEDENSSELGYFSSLHVDVELPEPLPDVKPSEGSSGGFDVTIKDWGKPEDIDIEL